MKQEAAGVAAQKPNKTVMFTGGLLLHRALMMPQTRYELPPAKEFLLQTH